MKRFDVSVPELAFVGATRAMAGAGVGLLVGACLAPETRRRLGWTLLALGVMTTVPIAMQVVARARRAGTERVST